MQSIPILALHGSASSGSMWKSLARRCGPTRTVLTPNLPGYDKIRPQQSGLESSLSLRAKPLLKLIRQQPQVHLVAHSFGSAVALEILKSVPRQIKSLTFYEPVIPAIFKVGDQEHDARYLGDLLSLAKIVGGTSGYAGMETFINFWHSAGAWSTMPPAAQAKLASMAPIVLRDFQEAMKESETSYSAMSFRHPLRILVGANTKPHAQRMTELLLQFLPHGHAMEMEGMSHLGPATHADKVNGSILQHIQHSEEVGHGACCFA